MLPLIFDTVLSLSKAATVTVRVAVLSIVVDSPVFTFAVTVILSGKEVVHVIVSL